MLWRKHDRSLWVHRVDVQHNSNSFETSECLMQYTADNKSVLRNLCITCLIWPTLKCDGKTDGLTDRFALGEEVITYVSACVYR